jgi:hypothetical protein
MKNAKKSRLRTLTPILEMVESRVLMTARVFDLEPNNTIATAQVIPLAQREVEIKGRITDLSDTDIYTTTLPTNSTATLKFKPEGRIATTVTISNASGTVIGTLGSGTGLKQLSLPVGEPLFFSVSGGDKARYEAELKFRVTPPPTLPPTPITPPTPGVIVSEVESNDRAYTATPVVLDPASMPTLSGTVTKNVDKYDWFALTAPGTGTLAISLRSPVVGRVASVEVIDATTGRKLAETKPERGMNTVAVNLVAGQKVYFKIEAESNQSQSYLIDTGFSASVSVASVSSVTTRVSNSSGSSTHDGIESHGNDLFGHDNDDYEYRGSRTAIVSQARRNVKR